MSAVFGILACEKGGIRVFMIFLHTCLIDRLAFALSFKFIKNHTEVVPTCVGVTFLYSQGIANLNAVKDVQ